jgi:hypothetical protein
MGFQTSIAALPGLGVIGELYVDSPRRAQSFILNSVSAAYNVFGRGFSKTSEGVAAAGNTGSAVFAGILVNPKSKVSRGVSNDPIAPSLTLNNYEQGDLLTMGSVIVTLPASAALGDLVVYDNTTGVLSTITPSTTLPVGKSPAYAYVDYFTVTAAGLAVITLSPTVTYVTA